MRIFLVLSLSLGLAACGGSDKPEPTPPAPDPTTETPTEEPAMMTPEECETAGGTVVGDIGDGSVKCADGMAEIGNVSGGVEQQLCCQPTPDSAE